MRVKVDQLDYGIRERLSCYLSVLCKTCSLLNLEPSLSTLVTATLALDYQKDPSNTPVSVYVKRELNEIRVSTSCLRATLALNYVRNSLTSFTNYF